jgi:PAS domain S-box-containing protein
MRERALADAERELRNMALVLAEHTEQTFQSIVLIQDSIVETVRSRGIATAEEFNAQMSAHDVHRMLRDKVSGLPVVDTIALLSTEGRLLNFGRFWPIPHADFSDRSYFRELFGDLDIAWFVSEPLHSRQSGAWTIYLSRRVTARNGETIGVIVGAITLAHFEELFGSIALSNDSSISLFRQDGVLLVRYPSIDATIGRNFIHRPNLQRLVEKSIATRAVSAIDGQDRLFASRRLDKFPIAALVTTTASAALADWRWQSAFTAGAALLACLAIIVMFAFIARVLNRRYYSAERKIAAQKLQLDIALNHMSQGLCMYDAQARLVVCNDRFIRMNGMSREVAKPGAALRDVLRHAKEAGSWAADPDKVFDGIMATVAKGQSRNWDIETENGRAVHVVEQAIPSGGWVVTMEDVTDRRRAEQERDRNREFLDRVIENVPSTILVKDAAERQYRLVNKAGEQLFGMSRDEFLGKTVVDLFDKEPAEAIRAHDDKLIEMGGELTFAERPIRMPDGRVRHVKARTICIRADDGTPQYLVVVLEDVTEQRLVEQQLLQAQKMEAVGRLTGGLAHDFNNLLLIIIGNLDLLAERVGGDREAAERVRVILESSLRGADLTRRLLAFSRRQALNPKRLDVNQLVESTAHLLRRTLGENVVVQLAPAPDAWPANVDEAQLEAALVNIAINARDAMPDGGTLAIATRNAQLDEAYCAKHPEVAAGDYVAIEIADNGTGMPPDVLGRIFEPFFTTKGSDHGTGLGLSTVLGFLRQSGGHIHADSEVGIGTTFTLYLPRAAAQDDRGEGAPTPAAPAAPGATEEIILVVEDNPGIRSMVAAQLRDLGYRVLQAENALEALEQLDGDVDLLFTDIVMPGGTNGKQLATIARLKRPDLKVLFTSGFPGAPDCGGAALEPTDVLLKKPYRKWELAKAIRDALEADRV